jgi:hypothetical protein
MKFQEKRGALSTHFSSHFWDGIEVGRGFDRPDYNTGARSVRRARRKAARLEGEQ